MSILLLRLLSVEPYLIPEFHFTPKHGSWLNVQELEWSALARQALSERVGDQKRLERLVTHWLEDRRERAVKINWQFTTSDAHQA